MAEVLPAVLGFGAAQPSRSIPGEELGAPFGRTAEWIESRTGIQALRRIAEPETLTDLAATAARDALTRSDVAAEAIDLVIGCSCSVAAGDPGLHEGVVRTLAPRAAGFQLNSACSGFCYALACADGFIRGGSARHVLIVAAEHMSWMVDPADLGTSIIFGDGAGAAVVGPSTGSAGIGPVVWGSDGAQRELIAFDEDFMRMQGQAVFRWAVADMAAVARDACLRAGVDLGAIEVFVPHQANLRIVKALTEKLGLAPGVVVADDIVVSGNTSAASIPIAVTQLAGSGRIRPGQLALFLGFGAGLAWAGQVVRLP